MSTCIFVPLAVSVLLVSGVWIYAFYVRFIRDSGVMDYLRQAFDADIEDDN